MADSVDPVDEKIITISDIKAAIAAGAQKIEDVEAAVKLYDEQTVKLQAEIESRDAENAALRKEAAEASAVTVELEAKLKDLEIAVAYQLDEQRQANVARALRASKETADEDGELHRPAFGGREES